MTVKSSVLREQFLAKHILSAFMWAIAAHIPKKEFDLTSAELHSVHNSNPDDPKWNSLKLTNPTIQKMARGIERAGLGTLEEAYMTIIPPLSVANVLPNEAVVDFVRLKAREHEQSRQWHEAFDAYKQLLELCQPRGSNDRFVYKAVAAVIDFLVLSTSAPLAEDRETSSGSEWNLGKVRSDLAEVLNSKALQDVTFNLRTIYDKQGRIKDFDNVIIRGKGRSQFTRPLEKRPEVSFVCPSWHSKLDPILSMKTVKEENTLSDEELHEADILGWTPLNYAVIRNPKLASNILSRWSEGAKKKDFAERTPLQYAVMRVMYSADRTTLDNYTHREKNSLVKRLLEKAPKPERGRDGLLPLHWAAKLGDEEAVDLLLDNHSHGNKVNSADNWGRTALHLAACRGALRIVDRLLVKGANIDAKDHFGNTALMLAVEMEQDINKRLTEAERQNAGERDKAGREDIARQTERKDEIEEEAGKGGAGGGETEGLRLEGQASEKEIPTTEKKETSEKEHLSTRWEETRGVIQFLLGRKGVGPESAGGGDLLLWAVTEGYKTFFGQLMEKNAKDDERDSTGRTALHIAAMSGFEDVVKQLLDRWGKEKPHETSGEKAPTRQQESGATNEETSYTKSNTGDQKFLQASQVSNQTLVDSSRIDPRDREDMTPLLLAARENHADIVEMLLNRGAHEEAKCSYGRSPLSWAAERGHAAVVKALLNRGANIAQNDSLNKTPLVWAEKGHTQIVELFLNLQLNKLPRADGAAFNSQLREHDPQCLPGTQDDLIQQIMTWSENPNGVHIFWLNGMAGTGKSTIARTLAHAFASRKRLGASFFFSRSQSDLCHATKFFTTIAAQLANRSPTLRRCIFEAIAKHNDNDNDIAHLALSCQWRQFVFQPLSKLEADSLQSPLILVIDALDECEGNIKEILQLLTQAKHLKTVQLRVFVTSRPEVPIRLGFREMSGNLYRDLPLRDMPPATINDNISVFFRHKLREIREEFKELPSDWPGERDTERLVQKSGGSFIYAATACQFIRYRPEDHLSLILQEDTTSQSPTKQLDRTYIQVLRHAIVNYEEQAKEESLEIFRLIVGSITTVFHPLTANTLAKLLSVPTQTVGLTLDSLRSGLDVPESQDGLVRLLHLSFRDFLLDQQRCFDPQFWISEKKAHNNLFICCLKLMSNHLRRDMCNLRLPGALATEVEQSKVEEYLPPGIQYACRYWVYHLQRSNVDLCDNGQVHIFLQKHLLHWLEALSLMGNMPDGVVLVITLESMLMVSDFIMAHYSPMLIWQSSNLTQTRYYPR
jgi:ankyrin repeat protein